MVTAPRIDHPDDADSFLPEPGSFRVAFIEINITPSVSKEQPLLLQGLAGPPRPASSVSTPLMMQLLLLEDDHRTRVLMVSADLFGFGHEMIQKIRAAAAQWGIEPEAVMLNASHTHYAPGTISHAVKYLGPFYEAYARVVADQITQNLHNLYYSLEECHISRGHIEARVGISRRLPKQGQMLFAPNPDGYYEKHTPFMLVNLRETARRLILVNHGCHPTGLGPETSISADFPGYLREALISSKQADAVMFLQGALGSSKEAKPVETFDQFSTGSEDARRNGELLAEQLVESIQQGLSPVSGSFFCVCHGAELPLKQPPAPDLLTRILKNPQANPLAREWAEKLLKLYPQGNYPTRMALPVQLVSMGKDVMFVTFPAEPVAELAKAIKEAVPNPDSTFILGCTNGLLTYLPSDQVISEGGYEAETSTFTYLTPAPFSQGTESSIVSTVKNLVKAGADEHAAGYGRYHVAGKDGKAFFVLSTGRCGTMTLAHLLDIAGNARVWHHIQPDFIDEALQAYWGNIDSKETFWKARYTVIHKAWSEGLIHGETDHLMTQFADMLAEAIPESKFLVLTREPRGFIRSGMRRDYYHSHPWDRGRLRPPESARECMSWRQLNQFEKICWLWDTTNKSILEFTRKVSSDRFLMVRFEDLPNNINKSEEIFHFLGLEGFDWDRARTVFNQNLNAQKTGNFPNPDDWPDDLIQKVSKTCGETAAQLGYSV
ncbi:MAG: sulfotransferase [Deltaproteobacteria bacterium]|nr:sulfotransferase [Deltaproteobacteria bacterium]